MARTPRFDLPGVPQHVIQRGHNRLPCFFGDADSRCYGSPQGEWYIANSGDVIDIPISPSARTDRQPDSDMRWSASRTCHRR